MQRSLAGGAAYTEYALRWMCRAFLSFHSSKTKNALVRAFGSLCAPCAAPGAFAQKHKAMRAPPSPRKMRSPPRFAYGNVFWKKGGG